MKKPLLLTTVGLSSALIAGGAVAGVLIPVMIKEKNGLNNFLPQAGDAPEKGWDKGGVAKKLNYVALGDSETAGYNGFLGHDALSYADFLANDLKNAGDLNNYSNFAVSGAKLGDAEEMFGENPAAENRVKQADLITVTIGANDLLAFLKILDLPFGLVGGGLNGMIHGSATNDNPTRNAIFGPTGGSSSVSPDNPFSPNSGFSPNELSGMLKGSVQMLQKMIATGDYSSIIDLQADFKEKLFDLLERNVATFMHDLHTIAPNAQIIMLGHAMPFAQWPADGVLDKNRPDLSAGTIRKTYERMIDSMRKGSQLTVSGHDRWVSFQKVDTLPIFKSSATSRDAAGNTFDSYIKHDDYTTKDFYVQNAMDNAADIHPSQFGHELIGNSVFSGISSYLGINTVQDSEKDYTFSQSVKYETDSEGNILKDKDGKAILAKVQSPWARMDENVNITHAAAQGIYDFLRTTDPNNMYAKRSSLYKLLTSKLPGSDESMINGLAKIQDWSPLFKLLDNNVDKAVFKPALAAMQTSGMKGMLKVLITEAENKDKNPTIEQGITDAVNGINAIFDSSSDSSLMTLGHGITSFVDAVRPTQAKNYITNLDNVKAFVKVISTKMSPALAKKLQEFMDLPGLTDTTMTSEGITKGQYTFISTINLLLGIK